MSEHAVVPVLGIEGRQAAPTASGTPLAWRPQRTCRCPRRLRCRQFCLRRDAATTATNLGADSRPFAVLRWPDAPLELEFAQYRFPFLGAFIDFPPGSNAVNLLGRQDFFGQFIVQFWDAAGLLNIDRSPDFATRPLA